MAGETQPSDLAASKWPLLVCSCGCIVFLLLCGGAGALGTFHWMTRERLVQIEESGTKKKLDPIGRSGKRLETPLVAASDDDAFLAGLVLAELSLRVYGTLDSAAEQSRQLGFESGRALVSENLVAWICHRPGVTVIVFQGTTDDLADWFTNGRIRREPVPGGAMHRGFHNAYQRFKPAIDAEIAKFPNDQIWITGHSLGGAEAMACGHDLAFSQGRTIAGIVTFGQPRLLGPLLRKNLRPVIGDRTLRFIHGRDIVPRVPPNYRHFADEIHFQNGSYQRTSDLESTPVDEIAAKQSDEDDREAVADHREELRGVAVGRRGQTAGVQAANPRIEDHSMEHYLNCIKEQVGP